jgi:hypothetical protein
MMTDSFDAVLLVRDVAFEYTQSDPFSLQTEQLGRTPSHYRAYRVSHQSRHLVEDTNNCTADESNLRATSAAYTMCKLL